MLTFVTIGCHSLSAANLWVVCLKAWHYTILVTILLSYSELRMFLMQNLFIRQFIWYCFIRLLNSYVTSFQSCPQFQISMTSFTDESNFCIIDPQWIGRSTVQKVSFTFHSPPNFLICSTPNPQTPQCTCPISHNAPHWNRNKHISVPKWCIVGYETVALWDSWDWSVHHKFWSVNWWLDSLGSGTGLDKLC